MRPPITRWASENVFARMAVATVALLVAFAVLPSIFAPISPASAEDPEPIITVDAHTDGLWGDHWSALIGITVTMGTDTWDTTTDENGNFWFDLRPFDVQAGQTFTATDGTTTKEHTVFSLAITGVDDVENVVSGTADAGTEVWVDVHGVPDVGRTVIADITTGIWVADFDDAGDGGDTFDLVPGTNGYTGQYDGDNDATNADWRVLHPTISVDAHANDAWGGDFLADVTITLTRGLETCTAVSDERGEFGFDLRNCPTPIDLAVGDLVSMTDGSTTKDVMIVNLAVTGVDPALDTVSGTADSGIDVQVWTHHGGDSVTVTGATWVADFSGLFDLVPGTGGVARHFDGEGDATSAEWRVLDPRITVDAHTDGAWGNDFLADTTITLTRGGDSCTTTSDEWGNFGFDLRNCPTPIDLAVGDLVSAADGTVAKDVTIVNLDITAVDPVLDTVTGTAGDGAEISVWVSDDGTSVTATGPSWTADFNGLFDLVPGTNGGAQVYDAEGDATNADWYVPNPRFKAGVDGDYLSGWDWLPNAAVDVTIDGSAPYSYPTDEWGNFDGSVAFDLEVGQHLVATDGVSTKDFVIRNLHVTDVDVDNDLVHGTSEPGDVVHVDAYDDYGVGSWRRVTADIVAGEWTADFSIAWQDQDELDIVAGSSGNARYYEPDGDETERSWHVSDPRITASVIHEEVWTYDFPDEPDGQVLYYRLDDPATPEIDFEGDMPLLVQNGSTESGDRSFGRYDVKAGQIFTVRNRPFDLPLDGGMERILAISHVTVDAVDPELDLISGFANPVEGPRLCVWSNDAELCNDNAAFTWNPDNTWSANFAAIGSDVAPGHWNSASQFEADGDETHFWWNLPPWIVVELAEEDAAGAPVWPDAVRAEQWTGPIVYLEVDGIPIAEWTYDGSGDYRFELPGLDLDPGQIVRIYDSVDDKTLLVEPLTIDQVNLSDDVLPNTVEGTSIPYRNVRVDARATIGGWWAERWVDADVSGYFIADFGVPGSGWREQWTAELGGAEGLGRNMWLEIYDSDNDRVTTQQCGGIARIEIARSDGRVDAYDFPEGSTVTLEIDDPTTPEVVDYTDTAVAVRDLDNPCETIATFEIVDFDIPDDAAVSAGAGDTTVTTIVIPFTIDNVDPDTDTVSGQAAIGADVYVEADGNWRYVVAIDDPVDEVDVGYWEADFSVRGPDPGEEYVVDLGPGSSGRALMLDSVGNTTELSWRISAAQFQVSPADNNIGGNEWAPNGSVTVKVNGTEVPGSPFDTDDGGNFGAGWDLSELDIVAGDFVEISDGDTTKDHTVTDLVITGVDELLDVVSGTAAAGSTVDVWDHDTGANATVAADGSGAWDADFSGIVDLVPGSNGNSGQCDDDNDCTNAGWRIANAQFQVSPADNNIGGNEWAPNGSVTVKVNGTEVPGSPFDTDDGGNFGAGWDPAELDIQSGDLVVVSDGDTTKDHTVTDLVITGVDELLDVVSGTAAAGSTVDVWDHDTGANATVAADGSGAWDADFSGIVDLVPGSNGNSGQCDDDNDCTNAGWRIVNPSIQAAAASGSIWAMDFEPNSSVDITIDGLPAGTYPTDEQGQFHGSWGGAFEVPAGSHVFVTDGITTKDLIVTDLAVTNVDEVSDVVSGTAVPGTTVDVWDHQTEASLQVVACDDSIEFPCVGDSLGTWHADFSGVIDLVPGSDGNSGQHDSDGDTTYAFWDISAAQFNVYPADDNIDGSDFTPNGSVTVTVNGTEVPGSPFDTDEGGNFGAGWGLSELDIVVGDFVEISDGDTTKDHTVTALLVTGVDEAADVVSGLAEPGSSVDVWVDDSDAWLQVTACNNSGFPCNGDAIGTWHADFTGLGGLVSGSNGNSGQCDGDNDCTNAGWRIPAAQFTVSPADNSIGGNEFELTSSVTVEVGGIAVPGSPFDTDEGGNFQAELDVVAGDVVSVSDGTTTKSHTVTHLVVTGADEVTNTVSGTAAAGSTVDVWVHDTEAWLQVTACDDVTTMCAGDDLPGTWHADFTGLGGLVAGSNGNSGQCDGDNDCTNAGWWIPNAQFQVSPADNSIGGNEFAPIHEVTITVNGTPVPGPAIMTDEGGNFQVGWDPFVLNIEATNVVSASDGTTTKSHTVTGLVVTGVDEATGVVSGMAEPGSTVDVWIHDDTGTNLTVTACNNSGFPCNGDAIGTWHADFTGLGGLVAGSNGNSGQWDDDNDATMAGWWIVNPTFAVGAEGDGVEGWGWNPDGQVTIVFDDDDDPLNGVLFTAIADTDGESIFSIDLWEVFNIEPGMFVQVTDSDAVKTHWVTGVTVTDVDVDSDVVSGFADPGAEVEVMIWTDEFAIVRVVIACDDGESYPCEDGEPGLWQADFSVASTNPDNNEEENQPWDIDVGTSGSAFEYDDDGDSTQADWWVRHATFVVSAEAEWLNGGEWAPDSVVTITFDDDDNSDNGVLFGTTTDSDGDGNLYIELWEEFDIQPGQYVVVTDGDVTKTHWVTGITVTDVDPGTDTVTGTAEPGAEVLVEVHAQVEGWLWEHFVFQFGPGRFDNNPDSLNGHLLFRQAVAHAIDRDALVAAVPSVGYTIDSYLDAYAPVVAGDAWAQYPYDPAMARVLIDQLCIDLVRDCVANPPTAVLSITTNDSRIELAEQLSLMLEDVGIDLVLDQNDMYRPGMFEGFFDLGEWAWVATPTHESLVEIHEAWDPEQRFQDNMYHWGTLDSSVINASTARMAELVGLMHETDDGTLLEGYFAEAEQILADEVVFIPLYVRDEPDEMEESPQMTVVAGPDGTWAADFNGLFDIGPGTEGSASEPDDDGDRTQADWRVRGLPHFGVSADIDFIEGYEFSGSTVTITFDDNDDPSDGVLFTDIGELDPEGSFNRLLEGEFNIEVGQFVTVTDGTTTKTTWVAPVDITDADLAADTITGVADPDVEIFLDDNRDLHWTVSSDEVGDWFADLSGEVDLFAPWFVVANQTDEDDDRTFAVWETGGIVEGQVLLDDAPLAGVEVWLTPDQHTCTDTEGNFEFADASMIYIGTHGGMAATGPAVDTAAACPNSEFVNSDGIPLLGAFHGDFDLWDGYEYIEFNVERAAALQTVTVEEFDGADWAPLDDVMVQAFDMNDPDFIAAYGSDPDPDAYRDIFNSDLGQIEMTWTGAYLFSPPGSSELRYSAVTDVLILAEAPYGMILGDQTSAAEFADRGDGVRVGPVVVFRIGPPVITAIVGPDQPVAVNTEATISATFVDPTIGDSHTATIEWGDGTTTDADVFFDAGDGAATGTHAYIEAGVYTVIVTVTDSGGLADSEEFRYIVIYDPDGGFVTGGGWIYSPAGAYAVDRTLEGTANFGFVSKYKKGKVAPSGNAEFQFHAGDLNFHSDVYDWLVIAGVRAQFKGTGTINGAGEFGFMITAVDEALTSSTDVDLFRIRIWDKATDEVIYDNQMDEVDGAAVTTEISGGSIVIHKARK